MQTPTRNLHQSDWTSIIDSGLWDCSLYSVLSEILLPANLLIWQHMTGIPAGWPVELAFRPYAATPWWFSAGGLYPLTCSCNVSMLPDCLPPTVADYVFHNYWIKFHFMDDFARQGGGPKQSSRSCTGVSQRCGAWRPFGHSGWGTQFSLWMSNKCLWPPGPWLLMDIV